MAKTRASDPYPGHYRKKQLKTEELRKSIANLRKEYQNLLAEIENKTKECKEKRKQQQFFECKLMYYKRYYNMI